LRLGCETYAVELNPVAHIIELCTLVYPQKYGKKLADEVEKWGNWVIEKVREEIGDLDPSISINNVITNEAKRNEAIAEDEIASSFLLAMTDEKQSLGETKQSPPMTDEKQSLGKTKQPRAMTGDQLPLELGSQFSDDKSKNLKSKNLTPVAYLWTRTVKCPNPACGAVVPLVRQTWLCKKSKKYVALKVIPNHETKQVEFEVVEAATEKELGFDPATGSSRGNSTCRHCGTTVKTDYVKEQGKADNIGQQLMAIICTTPGAKGKTYLSADEYQQYLPGEIAIKLRIEKLLEETGLTVPYESLSIEDNRNFWITEYGLTKFGQLFTPRQLLSLMTFVKWVRLAHQEMLQEGYEKELAKAISTYMGILCDRLSDYNSSITTWHNGRELIGHTFTRQALPMVWDFAEINPIGSGSGNARSAIDWILQFIRQESVETGKFGILQRNSATSMSIESESLDAVITDPPYFDSVPYADLSDYFYVWLKRSIGHIYPEHFSSQLTPKKNEAIMEPSRHGGDKKKAAQFYEEMMHKAFCEASRVLKPNGMMVVVYAHKTTSGWSTLIDSLRRAGFTITEAWPLDTEMGSRLRGQNSAALASSIFLVSRKRTDAKIGDYAMDVRPQLSEIVQSRVKTLLAEGVTGADLVIACIGAGLRAYTQYDRVELPNGDELDANSFLDEVQKEVLEAILTDVLLCDKKGVSAVDKPTQYYILGRYEYGEAIVEFDEANTLARGVGVELDSTGGLTDGKLALVKKTKNQVQLRDYSERGADEDLGIQKTEKIQKFNVKSEAIGAAPTLIDVLHRLLWLSENKPQEIQSFLNLAQPDATQLRLVAQALGGRALTPEVGATDVVNGTRTKEQQQIDTLLASWKRVVEDNLFTQSK
jgi:putative DNA methylase